MMQFISVKLQAQNVQTAILLLTDSPLLHLASYDLKNSHHKQIKEGFGNLGVGIGTGIQIYKFSLTQCKSPLQLKVSSKCFCQKVLFSLMLRPSDLKSPATQSEKNWQRYLAENNPKF